MALQRLSADAVMLSAFTAESAYDTLGTVNASNFCTLVEFQLAADYDDKRRHGQGEGAELGFESWLTHLSNRFTLTIPFLRPNDLAFMLAYALGTNAATQDGGNTAYRHKATRAATLPSFSMIILEAGIQKAFTGCKINQFTLSRNDHGWQGVAEIISSGRRASNADSFVAEISEAPLLYGASKIWTEEGANIDIASTPTQGSENISAATPDDQKASIISGPTITIQNNLRADQGYNASNANAYQARGQLEAGAVRPIDVEWQMYFEDDAELNAFLGSSYLQTHVAMEINCTMDELAAIDGGNYYNGFVIQIPRVTYEPIGGAGDDDGYKTRSIRGSVKTPTSSEDGTDEPIICYVYNGKAAYAA